ncbi:serine/threonine-protein kinase [Actinomadura sp. NEAU-AAG7]|uniref:serine/threonine protein kinase n=1 Tax=Actinomadura sp. NEAU-AAG7 TaxID=2839640 RepID=UPI001BE4C464|nr:serine/threonine-protein kinase [Actinomadura sp. NEAU-AAG7]MBT2208691.1 serine/threonine protein kinase [Actinomadura sp. NEAU-AAG7]
MTGVSKELIKSALSALGVEDEGEIARGGQKVVHRVRTNHLPLVLKVIMVTSTGAAELRRAEREVELLASLDSPHVVRVASGLVELGDPISGAAWLEEFLDGEDLTGLLYRRQWTWEETARLGLEIAKGLGVGHAKGVVHRDLSSNNIRRVSDGTYKVMDFGFARHTLRSGLTVAGQPGTAGFLSPEHLQSYSGSPTAASDVFCVGILMYAALTKRLPIPYSGDDTDYLHRLSAIDIIDIGKLRPDLKPQHQALIKRCLHHQPARRYLNGVRLAAALEEVS